MTYSLDAVEQSFAYFPDESLYANMAVGSNGDPYGDPTISAGDDQGEEVWGYQVWDSNTTNGFDTGSIPVQFTGSSDGNETLIVGGTGTPMSYSGDAFGAILSVQLQTGVQIPGSASLDGICLDFYNGNQLVESDSIGTGPSVNTINTPSTPVAEQVLTIIPSVQNANKVVAFANMRMQSPTSNPNPSDMFCNIYINGNAT